MPSGGPDSIRARCRRVVVDVGVVGGSQDARLTCGGELAGNSSRPPTLVRVTSVELAMSTTACSKSVGDGSRQTEDEPVAKSNRAQTAARAAQLRAETARKERQR